MLVGLTKNAGKPGSREMRGAHDLPIFRRSWTLHVMDCRGKNMHMHICICIYIYMYICMYTFIYACRHNKLH